jgi:hypothetical protein
MSDVQHTQAADQQSSGTSPFPSHATPNRTPVQSLAQRALARAQEMMRNREADKANKAARDSGQPAAEPAEQDLSRAKPVMDEAKQKLFHIAFLATITWQDCLVVAAPSDASPQTLARLVQDLIVLMDEDELNSRFDGDGLQCEEIGLEKVEDFRPGEVVDFVISRAKNGGLFVEEDVRSAPA